ncbi:MAG: aerotolerance regulator BatA [Candidatus Aenigmatarchaeota archaeon]|nr:MAG: aerotolerance regulator BatA [Candidatus Aenigmarchaeota archaeon]
MWFHFGEPELLLFLAVVPLVIYFYRIYNRKKREAALKFSTVGIVRKVSPKRNIRVHLPFMLLLLVMTLLILGLCDPRIPLKTAKEGVNVVLVIDDSGSMAATDYKPTRLEAAKNAAEILINSLKPKDNVGIVIFESGATTASYLTPFKDRAIQKLRAIEQREGRTAIGDGLSLAVDMATSIPNKKKVIILLSDGVNNAGVISPQEAVEYAKANKIQVYTVGMGSEKPVVLGYDIFGNPQYAELDEKTLKSIAEQTGGRYYKSVNKDTLDEIYRNIGENIEREWEDTSIKDWFFAAALIILLLNMYIIYGKYRIVL